MPATDPQVVILCGGLGTRIRDVADDIPKPMIPIGGQPILWHIMKGYAIRLSPLRALSRIQGLDDQAILPRLPAAHCDFTLTLELSRDDVAVHGPGLSEDWESPLPKLARTS